jgi:hypothetical protein
MNDNKGGIIEEFERLKGQFVINASWKIERLVAIGEDEWDYYWITYNGRKLTWNTCVGGLMPLKGHLQDKDYNELVRLAKLNHYDQPNLWMPRDDEKIKTTKSFNDQHKREVVVLGEGDELLTEICWDLN